MLQVPSGLLHSRRLSVRWFPEYNFRRLNELYIAMSGLCTPNGTQLSNGAVSNRSTDEGA